MTRLAEAPRSRSSHDRHRDTSPSDLGDAELVEAIARRREDALAETYRRHAPRVAAVAVAVLGNRASGDDVTQEVFLRLWRDPHKYDPVRGSLRAYLLTMAHGRAVDLLRAERSRSERQDRHYHTVPPVAGAVDDGALESSVAAALRTGVAGLPADERDALTLAYFGGYTYRQVATILERPEGTVKSQIRRGLRRLRTVAMTHAVADSN